MMAGDTYAARFMRSHGLSERNTQQLIAWWLKTEAAGRPPDVRQHLIQLRAGVAFPVERLTPPRLRLRTTGEPRMPSISKTREQTRCPKN